jgi:hypothetical protein
VKAMKLTGLGAACLAATLAAGCGEVARSGRSPVQIVVVALEGASGAESDEFGGTLRSDVVTLVQRQVNGESVQVPTTFDDAGRVTMRLVLKDQGVPGSVASPSLLNAVTINRYRVRYIRSDGRNVEGTDVPYAFDSAATFTVPPDGDVTAGFTLVRHTSKFEAPLAALASSAVIISTIAEVTFYGQDMAGNEVISTANIGIFFGNFGDPQ